MTAIRHSHRGISSSLQGPMIGIIVIVMITLLIYLIMVPPEANTTGSTQERGGGGSVYSGGNSVHMSTGGHANVYREKLHKVEDKLISTVQQKREQLAKALDSLSTSSNNLPGRLKLLRDSHQIVGERLTDIKKGKETIHEILHAAGTNPEAMRDYMKSDKPPMKLDEIVKYLDEWIHGLHATLEDAKTATYEGIWQAYHDYTVKTLYVWDREYLSRMPIRRKDNSIYLSLASYRDENCINTIKWAYEKAKNPEKLFVGLVQQNCHKDCMSGVLEGGKVEPVEPDLDVYKTFCEGEGKKFCDNGQVRVLNIDEPESLGPYAARYFASKMWFGEQWFMQTDAHMTFAKHWDAISIDMLKRSPAKKPVISHYPPPHTTDLDQAATEPAARLCGPMFATSDLENQIIRLEGGNDYDKKHLDVPRFAPFTAAGYFVAHSDFLREVPFDPFLPWIFMGEEIIMSTRLWTSGYDIFSPSQNVVGHMYARKHKPKFWESVHRAFSEGVHNPLQMMVLDRVKYQLGYPEAAKDMLSSKSLLTAVEQYSMGTERPLSQYLDLVGLDMTTKEVTMTQWCETGQPPPGFEQFNHLYK